jgi:hypothetical protein
MYFAATSQDNKTTYIQSGYNSLLNNLRPVIIGTIEIAHHLYQYGADQYLHSREDWQERWMVWVAGGLFTLFWGDDGSKDVESELKSVEKQMNEVLNSCDLRGKGRIRAT